MAIPVAGELEALLPNVWRLCAPNPGPMTGPGTNTYLYGSSELAVFDPGPPIAEHVARILDAQETLEAPITRIFASHTHQDHSPAVALLEKSLPEVEIIGVPAAPGQQFEDRSFQPTLEPEDGHAVDLPDGRVVAIHTPGHVENHFCYLLEEHGLLTTGDHLMSGSTVVIIPPKGNMRDYINSLRKLLAYPIKVMAPGHGDLINDPEAVVAWTVEHRLQREAKVESALQSLEPATIKQLVGVVYADTPAHLHPVAELSLHAHLIKLREDGRAAVADSVWSLV